MPDTEVAAGDKLIIAGKAYTSRLIVGTGKYASYAQNAEAAEAAGAEIVTVALRRVNVADKGSERLVDHLDPKRFTYLPNTAGCFTAEDAVRTLRLAREAGGWNLVKLEVLADQKTLYPDMIGDAASPPKVLVEGRLRRDGLLLRRPVYATQAGGGRLLRDHAARLADRLGPRHPEPREHPADRRAGESAGASSMQASAQPLTPPSRWSWAVDGVLDEHRHRRRERSDPHGPRDEACGDRRPRSLSRRPHAEEALCRSVQPAWRADLAAGSCSSPAGASLRSATPARPAPKPPTNLPLIRKAGVPCMPAMLELLHRAVDMLELVSAFAMSAFQRGISSPTDFAIISRLLRRVGARRRLHQRDVHLAILALLVRRQRRHRRAVRVFAAHGRLP